MLFRSNKGEKFRAKDAISFNHVSFSYPSGHEVLRDINLKIPPAQSVAIVGGSGAGKTTILDLILGLWMPTEGTIYYGDIAHDHLDFTSVREEIAYISQDTTLFDGTLRENLTLAKPDATEEEIKQICQKVHIDEFISRLADGLDSEIGENGIKLSGEIGRAHV